MAALAPHAGFWLLSRSRGCPNPAGSSIAGLTKGPSGAQVTALGGSQVPVLGGSLSRPGRGQKGKTSRAAAEPIAEAEGVEPEVLSELSQYLERELPLLFTPQGMQSEGKFDDRVEFEDPITRYDSLSGYLFNIAMLRALFDPVFQLHSVFQSGPAELTTRWTMKMYFKLLPWQPEVVFTGLSIYGINPRTGRFKSHRDVWDSIQDNAYFSREGLLDLIRECAHLYGKPRDLGSPAFDVLVRRASYEVRRYQELALVLTPWKQGEAQVGRPDSLQLQTIQKFVEGLPGVAQGAKGALGMPVVWQMSERRPGSSKDGGRGVMFGRPLVGMDAAALGAQYRSRAEVSVAVVPSTAVAVTSFAGDASLEDFEAAEALLRAALLKDGEVPLHGPGAFSAAKYSGSSSFRPPALQRNEVMIWLEDFAWP